MEENNQFELIEKNNHLNEETLQKHNNLKDFEIVQ